MSPDPTTATTGTATAQPAPTPAVTAPAPAAAAAPAPQSPAPGPGTSGTTGSGTPNPTPLVPPARQAQTPPAAAATPAAAQPAAPPTFDEQFRQRYGMTPDQAQMLMAMGYQTYRGQGSPAPAAQPQPQPAPAAAESVFGLPAFDYGLLNFVARGADGTYQVLPGGPPDAAIRVQDYQQRLQDVQKQFWQDPGKYLMPLIEKKATEIANQVWQRQQQQYQNTQFARQTLAENSSWLYQQDASGNVLRQFNPVTGQMEEALSPYGQAYHRIIVGLRERGVTDPALLHQTAVTQIQNYLLQQRVNQLQAPAQQQQSNQQLLSTAAAQQQAQPAAQPVQMPPQEHLSLRDRMRRNLDQAGITDDVARRQLSGAA